MKSKIALVVILGVIVLAVLVAVLLNKKSPQTQTPNPVTQNTNTNTNPSPAQGQPASYPAVDLASFLASFPAATSSAADKEAFNKKVLDASIDTDTLEIGACKPQPVVLHVHLNKPITVENHDTAQHSITHTQFTITVPQGGSQKTTPAFQGEGAYGYKCDGQFAGIMYVTQ